MHSSQKWKRTPKIYMEAQRIPDSQGNPKQKELLWGYCDTQSSVVYSSILINNKSIILSQKMHVDQGIEAKGWVNFTQLYPVPLFSLFKKIYTQAKSIFRN